MRSMKKPLTTAMDISPGFQIAPMIDVVFVIMLFFMAMASAMKAEQRLGLRLPGIVTPDSKVKMPASEVSIHVDEAGEISLNDGPLADPDDRRLQALENALQRLHQQSTMLEDKILITINAEPQASYQRVIEVLGVLNRAGLSNVTFRPAKSRHDITSPVFAHKKPKASRFWDAFEEELPGLGDDLDVAGQTVRHSGVLFVGAGRINRSIGLGVILLKQLVSKHPTFHFFAADVCEHASVDLHAGRHRLAALLFHFPAEGRIFDDVFLFERQVVLAEDRAYAFAPSAIGFQVGGDFRFVHK